MSVEKVRENRARRRAARQGYRLVKARRRDPSAIDYGQFMVVHRRYNIVVYGELPEDGASIDEVERWLESRDNRNRLATDAAQ